MFFDKETGTWVRLPIGWELHHPMVKTLVDQVEVSTFIYSKCPKISNIKVSDKMTYANSPDPDQTAPDQDLHCLPFR